MKKSFLAILLFSVLTFIGLHSCNKPKLEPNLNTSNKFERDLLLILKEKYGIENIKSTYDNGYIFEYKDGKSLEATPNKDNHYILKGSKLGNAVFELFKSKEGSDNPYNVKVISSDNTVIFSDGNPCSQHPKDESFDKCFVREWNAFCSDFISCSTQISNPIPVAIAIAIHCKICGS